MPPRIDLPPDVEAIEEDGSVVSYKQRPVVAVAELVSATEKAAHSPGKAAHNPEVAARRPDGGAHALLTRGNRLRDGEKHDARIRKGAARSGTQPARGKITLRIR